MAKLVKILKKDAKKAKKNAKKLSKQMFSEKGLMLKRTFEKTTAIYTGGKENKPIITFTTQGDYKMSVVKLAVILMCVLSSAALIVLLAKAIVDHAKASREEAAFEEYNLTDDELPF